MLLYILSWAEERILNNLKAHLLFENISNRVVYFRGIVSQLRPGENNQPLGILIENHVLCLEGHKESFAQS